MSKAMPASGDTARQHLPGQRHQRLHGSADLLLVGPVDVDQRELARPDDCLAAVLKHCASPFGYQRNDDEIVTSLGDMLARAADRMSSDCIFGKEHRADPGLINRGMEGLRHI
jgi:hypothetical protein